MGSLRSKPDRKNSSSSTQENVPLKRHVERVIMDVGELADRALADSADILKNDKNEGCLTTLGAV